MNNEHATAKAKPQNLLGDPNVRFAKKTIRLTFALWDATATHDVVIHGNTRGLGTLVGSALAHLYDTLPGDYGVLHLHDAEGNVTETTDDEERREDWLGDMLIKAEIIHVEAEG